jgi:ADP-ribosylation factor GTPase-activating protein 2/3
MQTITQESSSKLITPPERKLRDIDMDLDYLITGFESLTNNFTSNLSNTKGRNDEFIIEEEPNLPRRGATSQYSNSPQMSSQNSNKSSTKGNNKPVSEGDEARKKFGSAKAISSDQYFRDSQNDNSVSNNLQCYYNFHIYFHIIIQFWNYTSMFFSFEK